MIEGKKPSVIQKLVLNDATYENEMVEPTFINFFYGRNGVGKTTLAKAIRYRYDPIKNVDLFPDGCKSTVEMAPGDKLQNYSVLVYDQDYIDHGFKKIGSLDPLYTSKNGGKSKQEKDSATFIATETNVNIDDEIEKKKSEKEDLANKRKAAEKKKGELDTACTEFKTGTAKDFWDNTADVRADYPESQVGFMRGKDKEEKVLAKICETPVPKDQSDYTKYSLEEIKKLHEKVYPSDESAIPKEYTKIDAPANLYAYKDLSGADLMEKEIKSTSESRLTKLIYDLKSADWVRQGYLHYAFSEGNKECKCPFCQQKLPEGFKADLEAYFDKTYETDINGLNNYLVAYKAEMERIYRGLETLTKNSFPAVKDSKLSSRLEYLAIAIQSNLNLIREKIKEPAKPVTLPSLDDILADFEDIIADLNKKIEENNTLALHLKDEQARCNSMVWTYFAITYKSNVERYQQGLVKFKEDIATQDKIISEEPAAQRKLDKEIAALREKGVDIAEARENINKLLEQSGFQGFHLEPASEGKDKPIGAYRVVRENGEPAVNLSEGEQNFIAFLYFYYTVIGSIDIAGLDKQRVVVIDDPVSSMDSSALFIVSSLVRRLVEICHNHRTPKDNKVEGDNISQIFILTHNVYFHKEITLKQADDDRYDHVAFFLMRKNMDNKSTVKPCIHDRTDITGSGKENYNPVQNSYATLWTEYKELKSPLSVMNVIRQILEYYFIQLCGYDGVQLSDMIFDEKNLKEAGVTYDKTTRAVAESMLHFLGSAPSVIDDGYYHINDGDPLDTDVFRKVFEDIFTITGNKAHYKMMMHAIETSTAEPEPENDAAVEPEAAV